MIKAVIFDMDGVLIDTELEYSNRLRVFFKEHNFHCTDDILYSLIGCSHEKGDEIIDQITGGKIEASEIWKMWKQTLIKDPIDYLSIRVPGIIELMEYLKAEGYKIGLSSATEKNDIIKVMKICSLYQYFGAISSGHEVEASKPAPDVYLKTINDLKVNADECLVVEDSTYGIQAAKNAKVNYVVARRVSEYQLDQREADEIVDDLLSVIQILERKKH